MKTRHVLINAALFQALWFACIMQGWAWGVVPFVAMAVHFWLKVSDLKVKLACFALALSGIVVDALLGVAGVFQFQPSDVFVAGAIPLWLCFLWVGFCMTLPLSLSWMLSRPILLIALFAVAGPLSYAGGRALGALDFSSVHSWVLALVWLALGFLVVVVTSVNQRQKTSLCKPNGNQSSHRVQPLV